MSSEGDAEEGLSPPTPAVRQRMRRTGRRDTAPEMAIRRACHALGLRYRVDKRPIAAVRSRADMVFRRAKVAVYVDGCFWHRCPQHGTMPKKNAAYWLPKLEANVARDRRVDRTLELAGWTVVRVWEHEDPDDAAARIVAAVRAEASSAVAPAQAQTAGVLGPP